MSPRRTGGRTRLHAPARNNRSRGGSSKKGLIISLGIIGIAAIGLLIYFLIPKGGDNFSMKKLDKYVEEMNPSTQVNPGASVYLDFSNGMIDAYATPEAQHVLKCVIDKLNGPKTGYEFFSLASDSITAMQNMSQTELYNRIMNPASYDQERAPIEATLRTIVDRNQAAVLVTDFEEYNNGRIQQAAYAKDYFTELLLKGFNITFYKWDFVEKSKDKKLFIAVVDTQAGELASQVQTAVALANEPIIERFLLGGPKYSFPLNVCYPSSTKGGNYHNAEGRDIVSGVREEGDENSFKSYDMPMASADGARSEYSPLKNLWGPSAEYYPLGVDWANIIKNAEGTRGTKMPYRHFLGNLYALFGQQNGFTITGVEARAFDVQKAVMDGSMDAPQVLDVFTAGMEPSLVSIGGVTGWTELYIDFDKRFNGTFTTPGVLPTDLLRINLVISEATPNISEAGEFFAWPGNSSLSSSVTNVLSDPKVSPAGSVLISYFVKGRGK